MADGPDLNDQFPLRETLSPPLIDHPVYECAEAVYVTGFMAHAEVTVFANGTERLARVEPPFGFATITLNRPVKAGDKLTATQRVDIQTSPHSLLPVVVQPLDENRIRTTKPEIVEPLYECGRVVPVANLVPGTRLHVFEDGAAIGQAAVAQTADAVLTQPLHANAQVTSMLVACEGSGHDIKGPQSDAAAPPPLPAPAPPPAPTVDAASLIPGSDVVTLTGLLVGAEVEIFDQGVSVSSGWLATADANFFPVTPRLSTTPITATQALCGNSSPPSDPVVPSGRLEAPQVLGPICDGARYVVIRNTTINATVVVLRNGMAITHGGAAPGDLVLQLGQNAMLGAGDAVSALQYMDGNTSATAAPVIVAAGLVEPVVEIRGGEPFFLPQGNEEPIPGPVFPRGRGPGPVILIQACCTSPVTAWITGPRGDRVADLILDQRYPGYYRASWPWVAASGWHVPDDIPVGEYIVHVHSACQDRDGAARFYVVFDPATVNGPPRFSFDGTAVWFGTGANFARGLHYYLHCSDWRVFRIAIQAISGHTVPYDAAIAVARAEEALFAYSLDYHSNDVLDLIVNYTEAQCADDAACLTALLRAAGIPAHPVTADAGYETGAAYWTFDTWVEFLAQIGDFPIWRALHPHEYPGMEPEMRGVFGLRAVASKQFNDLILMANPAWVLAALDDGTDDVQFGRNACGEPDQLVTRAPWVDELCEAGYWVQGHWDCAGVRRRSLVAANGVRLSGSDLRFGGRIAGTVHLRNPMAERHFGSLVVELVTGRLESKSFSDRSLQATTLQVAVDPGGSVTLPFDFPLPPTLPPGHDLYLHARLDQRSALIMPVRLPSSLEATLDMPTVWREGKEGILRLRLYNAGDALLRTVSVRIDAPYALTLAHPRVVRIAALGPGEEQEIVFPASAVAPLPSGSLHVAIATANGGGVMLRCPFRVTGTPSRRDAHPGLRAPG